MMILRLCVSQQNIFFDAKVLNYYKEAKVCGCATDEAGCKTLAS